MGDLRAMTMTVPSGLIRMGVTVLLLAQSSCASGSNALRTDTWSTYETPHITLHTDASRGRSLELLRVLHRNYEAFSRYVFNFEPHFDGKTDVTFFSGLTDVEQLGYQKGFVGFFSQMYEEYTGISSTVVAGRAEPSQYEGTATHEIAHRFIAYHLPLAPTWLNEGYAKYLESVETQADRVVFGLNPLARSQRECSRCLYSWGMQPNEALSIPDLRSTNTFYEEDEMDRSYASAWAAVQALSEGRLRPRFSDYLSALHSGRVTEAAAFEQYFGEVDMESVHRLQIRRLSTYETERRVISKVHIPQLEVVQPVPMSPSEVHLMFSRLMIGNKMKEALEHAQAATMLEPRDPEARMMVGLLLLAQNDNTGIKMLTEAYELSGRKARYAAALIRATFATGTNLPNEKQILRKLVKSASTAQEFEVLTYAMLRAGRSSSALLFARKGALVDRGRASNLYALAAANASKGNFTMAYEVQQRAVNLSGHNVSQSAIKALEEYDQQRVRMIHNAKQHPEPLPSEPAPSE